jgi:hypothetical protein
MTPITGDKNTKMDLSNWAEVDCHKVKRDVKRLSGRIFAAKSKIWTSNKSLIII